MPFIEYTPKTFTPAHQAIIEHAAGIARAYAADGDSLTLRQLYYRFVAAGLIANKDTEYHRLGGIINDARYAGEFDWNWLTDRTRFIRKLDGSDEDPRDIVANLGFFAEMWQGQPERVEVWVEKDALIAVVGRACQEYNAPHFSCRGYTSASELWGAARRIEGYLDDGAESVTVIHLGDHDPSGIDMTGDIERRLTTFLDGDGYDSSLLTIDRIALNMPQVRQYNPPPNPAKLTDSRVWSYIEQYGNSSWELDALEPRVLRRLIGDAIREHVNLETWEERRVFEQDGQATLSAIGDNYDRIHDFLDGEGLLPEPTTRNDEDDE